MKLGRKVTVFSAAFLLGIGGMVVASPANALDPSCPVNYLCLYDRNGRMIFSNNGTYMAQTPGHYGVSTQGSPVYRSVNATLGKFCTYGPPNLKLTNVLAKQTEGVLASSNVTSVKIC